MHQAAKIQPTGLATGIYFGLADHIYHKDPALSRGGLQKLLTHYYDYYISSPLNPKYKPSASTPAMELGTLRHVRLLEPERFSAEFRHAMTGYDSTKRPIATSLWDGVNESMDMLRLVEPRYFRKGMPEVTIVWLDPETGLRMRARIDYLRTFGCLDYKGCADIDPNKLGWHINKYAYDLQAKLYVDGVAEIKKLLNLPDRKERMVIWGEHDPEWLEAFAKDPDNGFMFLFQRSTPPYVYRFYEFENEIYENAGAVIRDAKQIYLECLENFGITDWPPGDADPQEFSIYHLPRRIFDKGARPK